MSVWFPRLFPRHICTAEVSEARRGAQCHSASGMPELASEACGVLGAGLRKDRM